MEKQKKRNVMLIATLFILIATFLIVYFAVVKPPTAENIFNSSIDNVVEIKASSESIGESFGTAVLIDSVGTLVSNAQPAVAAGVASVIANRVYSSIEEKVEAARKELKKRCPNDTIIYRMGSNSYYNLTPHPYSVTLQQICIRAY